jgi:hypothetical protein
VTQLLALIKFAALENACEQWLTGWADGDDRGERGGALAARS